MGVLKALSIVVTTPVAVAVSVFFLCSPRVGFCQTNVVEKERPDARAAGFPLAAEIEALLAKALSTYRALSSYEDRHAWQVAGRLGTNSGSVVSPTREMSFLFAKPKQFVFAGSRSRSICCDGSRLWTYRATRRQYTEVEAPNPVRLCDALGISGSSLFTAHPVALLLTEREGSFSQLVPQINRWTSVTAEARGGESGKRVRGLMQLPGRQTSEPAEFSLWFSDKTGLLGEMHLREPLVRPPWATIHSSPAGIDWKRTSERVLSITVVATNRAIPKEQFVFKPAAFDRKVASLGAASMWDIPERNLVGQPAPDVSGTSLDGRPLSLRSLQDQVVVLSFWKTGTNTEYVNQTPVRLPATNELVALQRARDCFAGKPVTMIGVNTDPEEADAFVRQWVASNNITFVQLRDPYLDTAELYGIRHIPSTVLISQSGIVQKTSRFNLSLRDHEKLTNDITRLLAGERVFGSPGLAASPGTAGRRSESESGGLCPFPVQPSPYQFADFDGDGQRELLITDNQVGINITAPTGELKRRIALHVGNPRGSMIANDRNSSDSISPADELKRRMALRKLTTLGTITSFEPVRTKDLVHWLVVFNAGMTAFQGAGRYSVALFDPDGERLWSYSPDLAIKDSRSMLYDSRAGPLGPPMSRGSSMLPLTVAAADLDGDGKAEFAVGVNIRQIPMHSPRFDGFPQEDGYLAVLDHAGQPLALRRLGNRVAVASQGNDGSRGIPRSVICMVDGESKSIGLQGAGKATSPTGPGLATARGSEKNVVPPRDVSGPPEALAVIQRALKAYGNLRTYQDSVIFSTESPGEDTNGLPRHLQFGANSAPKPRATLFFERPNRIAFAEPSRAFYCDGHRFWDYSAQGHRYTESAAPKSLDLRSLLDRLDLVGLSAVTTVARILAQPDKPITQTLPEIIEFDGVIRESRFGQSGCRVTGLREASSTATTAPPERFSMWFSDATGLMRELRVERVVTVTGSSSQTDQPVQPRKIRIQQVYQFDNLILNGEIAEERFTFQPRPYDQPTAKLSRLQVLSESARVGQSAPDFARTAFDGKRVTLQSLRGQTVALHFWDLKFGVPSNYLRGIQLLADTFTNNPVVFLGVNGDLPYKEPDVREILRNYDIRFRQLPDPHGDLARNYKVISRPASVLIDPTGTVQHIGFGGESSLSNKVQQLLQGQSLFDSAKVTDGRPMREIEPQRIDCAPGPAENTYPKEKHILGISEEGVEELAFLDETGTLVVTSPDHAVLRRVRFLGETVRFRVDSVQPVRIGKEWHWLAVIQRHERAETSPQAKNLVALHSASGKRIWVFSPDIPEGSHCRLSAIPVKFAPDGELRFVASINVTTYETRTGSGLRSTGQRGSIAILDQDGSLISQRQVGQEIALLRDSSSSISNDLRASVLCVTDGKLRRVRFDSRSKSLNVE